MRQADAVYQAPKSRPLAILLALLLGSFGIHRFYVGPISWGIAYLVFFWTGIPGFLAWLEAIYWLTRSDVDWAQKYGGPVQESNGCAIGCLWAIALIGIIGIVVSLLMIPGLIFMGGEISDILSEIEQSLATPAPKSLTSTLSSVLRSVRLRKPRTPRGSSVRATPAPRPQRR